MGGDERSTGDRNQPSRPRRVHLFVPLCLVLAVATLALATRQNGGNESSPYPLRGTLPYRLALDGPPPPPTCDLERAELPPVPRELTFSRGQTLGGALGELGLTSGDVVAVVEALAPFLDVRRIRPGDRYSVSEKAGEVSALRFAVGREGRVRLEREVDAWRAEWVPFERRVVGRQLAGTIEGSLVAAVAGAGAPAQLAYEIAEVLQWDVDFSRDLRRGDRFEVIYDEILVEGRPQGLGAIWAVGFDNGGRRLEAYRYGEEGGYYDGEGRPLEKMFLRSPLKLAHVTSRFSSRRLHPVLKVYRPHWGVDFRAAVGTPVRVTASGVVTFAGWDRGGGNVVKVRHPSGYLTAYLHLSKFAPGIAPGRRVKQGDLIAYSGNTGLSTAPHLDYRVQRDGRWIDPLTLKNVPADPIPLTDIAAFLVWRDTLRDSLARGMAPTERPGWEAPDPAAGEVRLADAGAPAPVVAPDATESGSGTAAGAF